MESNLFNELKESGHGVGERERLLMDRIRLILEARQKQTLLERLLHRKPKVRARAWND